MATSSAAADLRRRIGCGTTPAAAATCMFRQLLPGGEPAGGCPVYRLAQANLRDSACLTVAGDVV